MASAGPTPPEDGQPQQDEGTEAPEATPPWSDPEETLVEEDGALVWRGEEESADPASKTPVQGAELELRDRMALEDQRQRHRLQPYVAAGLGVFTFLIFIVTLSFAAAGGIDAQITQNIINSMVTPLIISGVIAIVAWLFGGGGSSGPANRS